MRYLERVLIVLALPLNCLLADKLLLLGDSIDRYTVHEWCALKESQGFRVDFKTSWCSEFEENRGPHKWHCCSCQTENDTVAAVHLFGSSSNGPYHQGVATDVYQPTKHRLTVMIPKFVSLFGNPDRVMFHTSQWDMRARGADSYTPVDVFRNDTITRLVEVRAMIGDKVDLGVRTAGWSVRGGRVLKEYNDAIKDIAHAKNLTFFNFNFDIWSTVGFNLTKEWHLFRDDIHPLCPYPERAAERMLDRLYTNFVEFGSVEKTVAYRNKFSDMSSTRSFAPLYLDVSSKTTYYHNSRDFTWHPNPPQSFLSALRLGPADLFEFDSRLSSIVTSPLPPPPDFFRDGTVFNVTATNQLYHYRASKLVMMMDVEALFGLCKKPSDVIQLNDNEAKWLKLLTLNKAPLLQNYSSPDPWVLKSSNQRDLYLIKDCTRVKVYDVKILVPYNITEKDYVILDQYDNFNIIPLEGEM